MTMTMLNLCRGLGVLARTCPRYVVTSSRLIQPQSVAPTTTVNHLHTTRHLFYDMEIRSSSFLVESKKIFMDVKKPHKGEKYLKISELSNGRRSSIWINKEVAEKIVELFSNKELFQSKEEHLFTAADGKSYQVLRINNARGRLVDIVEKKADGKKFTIKLPEEGVGQFVTVYSSDIRSALMESREQRDLA